MERSADAVHFETITQFPGQRGIRSYSSYDVNPIAGKSYYRLKQVDPDGTATFSKTIISKTILSGEPAVNIYPNPIVRGSTINLSIFATKMESISIRITDMNGRNISTMVKSIQAGYNSWSLSETNLSPGNYLLECKGQWLGNIYKKITISR